MNVVSSGAQTASIWAELRWRLRRLGGRGLLRLMRLVPPSEWKKALRLFPFEVGGDGWTELRTRLTAGTVRFRNSSTDAETFWQVLVDQQYATPWSTGPVRYVVDAGANVGFASIYFLERYPTCQVLAIEPDPDNYLCAKHNLAPYAERCVLLHAAVWDQDTSAKISRGSFRDGREWATEVVPREGLLEGDVEALTLPTLLARAGFPSVDFLKMDIEGAESRVISHEANAAVIRSAATLAIELHGDEHRETLESLAKTAGWRLVDRGEVTFARGSR